MTDLLAGQVQSAFDNLPASIDAKQGWQAARAGRERTAVLPNVPTDWANSCRASRPAHLLQSVRPTTRRPRSSAGSTTRSTQASPILSIKARLAELGGTVFVGSPADFSKLIADETEKWGKVIRAANIKAE